MHTHTVEGRVFTNGTLAYAFASRLATEYGRKVWVCEPAIDGEHSMLCANPDA